MTSSIRVDDCQTNLNEEEELNPKFLLGLSIVVLGAMFAAITTFWVAHPILQFPDQTMYLGMAQLFLDGQRPYVDMVDFNPPLILYINIIPALMERWFNLHIITAFYIFVLGILMLSLLLSGFLMFNQKKPMDTFFYLPLLIGFVYSSQDLVLDFGQREHLLLLTYFPFFVLRYFRWNDAPINKYLAIFCGLYAGSCLSLKPHFLLMAASPELVYFLQKRSWRPFFQPEVFAVIAFGLTYGVHFFFLNREVSETFFHFVIPLVKNGYDYYTVSPIKILSDFNRTSSYLFAEVIMVAYLMRGACPFLAPVSAFTISSFFIYLFASQDWSHHWLPVVFGCCILIALEVAVVIKYLCSLSGHAQLLNLYMSSILAGVVMLGVSANNAQQAIPPPEAKRFDLKAIGYAGSCNYDDIGPFGDIVLKHSKRKGKILMISDAIAPGYPSTVQMDRRPASRYLHGMPLMMAKYLAREKEGFKDKDHFAAVVERIINEYGEDIRKNKPELIVIRNSAIMEPLQRAEFFSRFMKDYEQVQNLDEHYIYHRKN